MTRDDRAGSVAAMSRNAAWLLASRLGAQLCAIALTVLLAARIGLVGFGEYAFISAVVLVANVGTTFGTDMVLIREVAGLRRFDRAAAAVALQLSLSALAIAAIWLITAVAPARPGGVAPALRIMSLTLLPSALFSVSTAVLRGKGRLRLYSVITAAAAAVPLLAAAALIPPAATIVPVVVVLAGAQLALGLGAWVVCAVAVPGSRVVSRVPWSEVSSMARSSMSVGVLGLVGAAYQRLGAIAVALFAGPAATGWFAGGSRVVEASKTGHVALFTAVYPAMAEAHHDREPHRRAIDWSWRLSVIGAALISAALLLIGPLLVDGLYGPAFGPAGTGLAILALSVLPSTVATYQSLALLAAGRESDTLRILGISLGVLTVATGLLMPIAGWIGACWAVLIADTTNATLMLAARPRRASRTVPNRAMLRLRGESR